MKKLTVLNFGGGVQSTTIALMAAHGQIEKPDVAIFSDTGWEPQEVYRHVWEIANKLPFPLLIVSAGTSLRDDLLHAAKTKEWVANPPLFTAPRGILLRKCTQYYKINPLQKMYRQLCGLEKYKRAKGRVQVEQWLGISTDEAHRMKPAREEWIKTRWPLIELKMSRADCLQWLTEHRYAHPRKSSCLGCPFHGSDEWAKIRQNSEEWKQTVEVDEAIRSGINGTTSVCYLNSLRVPLVDMTTTTKNSIGNECEGVCWT